MIELRLDFDFFFDFDFENGPLLFKELRFDFDKGCFHFNKRGLFPFKRGWGCTLLVFGRSEGFEKRGVAPFFQRRRVALFFEKKAAPEFKFKKVTPRTFSIKKEYFPPSSSLERFLDLIIF